MSRPDNSEGWKDCPPGTLSNLLNQKRLEQRRQLLQRSFVVGSAVAVGAIGIGVIAGSTKWPREDRVNALSCTQVVNYLPAYIEGNLDKQTCRDIERHLKECPHCHEELKRRQNNS